jgi:cellulose synthase/poly-beta-1,6-N-acetylglucosamine synthase-like glycosyltransferase
MENLYLVFFIGAMIFSVSYALLILNYNRGWKKLKNSSPSKNQTFSTSITVIIPARNEELYIKYSLQAVLQQDYPKELFEIIVVDDHSTDHTNAIASQYANERLRVLKLSSTNQTVAYKKKAIKEAIKIAKGELIVTTDADCNMGHKWLASIADLYERKKPKMIVGPVCFTKEKTFFEKIQSLEFISLIGSTGASLFYNKPLMCNGANLAYEKKAFLDVNGFKEHEDIATGDDMLLMFQLNKKFPSSIKYLKSVDAIVYTNAKKTLKSFWEQRKRWVSKSKHYTNSYVILISLLIYINNFIPLVSILLSIVYPKFIVVFILSFALKSIADYFFLKTICSFFKKTDLMNLFMAVQLLYLVYVSTIGLIGNLISYKWKDRQYQH